MIVIHNIPANGFQIALLGRFITNLKKTRWSLPKVQGLKNLTPRLSPYRQRSKTKLEVKYK